MYVTHFEARGSGHFPTDMLRYDCCFPADSEAVDKISGEYLQEPVVVRLAVYHPLKKAHITAGRWESFGWRVTEKETRKL